LHEAHTIGLVHRDIKPNNIMLTQQGGVHDVTKVLDFGLVKNVDSKVDMTNTISDAIIGTPRFMSPEQILDPPAVDARSDIYALGAVGYYLLTGRFVFDGTNPIEICAQHLSAIPDPPSFVVERDIDSGLERIIMQCLEKKRDDRPASAAEIAEQLRSLPIERWSQPHASRWWEATGLELIMGRERDSDLGSFATIQAEPALTGRR
jgi:serine/threonine protein kinase